MTTERATALRQDTQAPEHSPGRAATAAGPELLAWQLQSGAGNMATAAWVAAGGDPRVQRDVAVQRDPSPPGAPATPPPDWFDITAQVVRTGAEVGRAIPGPMSILAGLTADGFNLVQDVRSLDDLDKAGQHDDLTSALVMGHDVISLINNVIQSFLSASEAVQLAATPVEGAGQLLAPVNTTAKSIKLGVDSVLLVMDIAVQARGAQQVAKLPPDSAGIAAWNGILAGARGNAIGDFLTTVMDVVDVLSAGNAQAGEVGTAAKAGSKLMGLAKTHGKTIVNWIIAEIGVWAGKAQGDERTPAGTPAPVQKLAGDAGAAGSGRQAAGEALLAGCQMAHEVHDTVTKVTESVWQAINKEMDHADKTVAALNHGKGIFAIIRESAAAVTATMNEKVASANALAASMGSAADKSAHAKSTLTGAQNAVNSLTVPRVEVPHVKDDGVVSSVVNFGADIAQHAANVFNDSVKSLVDELKSGASAPIQKLLANVDEIAGFLQAMQQQAVLTANQMAGFVITLGERLSKVHSVEDIANALLGSVGTVLTGEPFSLDDIRSAWSDVGHVIGQGEQFAQQLISGGGGGTDVPDADIPGVAGASADAPPDAA